MGTYRVGVRWAVLGTGFLVAALWGASGMPAGCDCSSVQPSGVTSKRCIQYYIDLPADCKPATLSLVDTTNAAVVWDRTIWSEEDFSSFSEEQRQRRLGNDAIIGIESNRIYTYEGPNGTVITIARREGDPNKWLLELCSYCHTIPTLRLGLDCPGTQTASSVIVGLTFDENDQYVMNGLVLVNGRKLTRENYNSFFQDCSVPYCCADGDFNDSGEIALFMVPDRACKVDLDAFRKDLCVALAAAGCRCDIRWLAARYGALRGYVYTNRCTPQVLDCIKRVLARHTSCKQVTWIGRQIVISPKPKPKMGVSVGTSVAALDVRPAKDFLLATLEVVPLPMEVLVDIIAGLPPLAPLPFVGAGISLPAPLGNVDLTAHFLTDGMLRWARIWPAHGLEVSPLLSADFHLMAYRWACSWNLELDLRLLAAGIGIGIEAAGGRFLPKLTSTDLEIQALLPEFCPDAFSWVSIGPHLQAFLAVGPPGLRLSLAGWFSLPVFQAAGAAGLSIAPPGGSITLSLRF